MMTFALTPVAILLGLVVLQRLIELVIAHRNTKRLLAAGGHEVAGGHYPLIVMTHAAWLIAMFAWAPIYQSVIIMPWLWAYLGLQVLRLWVMISLGRYWTTKIITVPDAPLVKTGPYKYLRHPNYVVVALEILVLPLVIGAWPIALFFSALNAVAMWIRINAENEALHYRA